MENEQIIHVADLVQRDGFARLIESFGAKDGHKIVAALRSAEDVDWLIDRRVEIEPTVAVIGDFSDNRDAEAAADRIRKAFPKILVVAILSDEKPSWADYNIGWQVPAKELVNFLTELQH